MSRTTRAGGCLLAVAAFTPISHASAHCFVGNRFFPATLNVDDPCVADELSLPTVSAFPTGDDPSVREVDISGELSKKITETFGISLEGTWIHTREPGGATTHGFDNLGTSFKFQFLTDPADEFVIDHRPCRILNRCRHPSMWIGGRRRQICFRVCFTTLTQRCLSVRASDLCRRA